MQPNFANFHFLRASEPSYHFMKVSILRYLRSLTLAVRTRQGHFSPTTWIYLASFSNVARALSPG